MNWLSSQNALPMAFIALAGTASGQAEGLHGAAAVVIAAEIDRQGLADLVDARVFYGDLTGTGTEDAIVFLDFDSGGSSERLTTWIWRVNLRSRLTRCDHLEMTHPRDRKAHRRAAPI